MIEKAGRFSLIFDVGGKGETSLDHIQDTIRGLGDDASKTQAKLSGLLDSMVSNEVKGFAENMMSVGSKGIDLFTQGLTNAVMTVMPLESALQRIGAATKLGQVASRGILEDFLQLAAKTPFTEEQVIGLGMALTQAKVSLDAFTDKSGKALTIQDALNEGWAVGNKELIQQSENLKSLKITSLTLLGDLASMQGKTGQQMDFFIRAFQKALSTGQLMSLAGDITAQQRQAIFGTMGGTSKVTAQQAMNNLFAYLKKEGQIGAMAAGGATMEGLMSTLHDIPGQLYRNILGMPGTGGLYDRIKAGFADLVDKLGSYFSDPKFLASARDALTPIVKFLLTIAEGLKKVTLGVLEFIKQNPQVTKLIAGFVFFGSILLLITGGLVGLAASIAGIGAAISLFGSAILTAMGPALAIVLGFIAAIGVLTAIGYVLYNAYERNFGGIKDAVDSVVLVFKGLYELISSMSGVTGEMSEETAAALEANGLLEFTIEAFGLFVRLKEAVLGFGEGVMIAWTQAKLILEPALFEIRAAMHQVFDAIGELMLALGMTITPDDLMTWRVFGQIVGYVVGGAFTMLANSIRLAVDAMTAMINAVKMVRDVGAAIPAFSPFGGAVSALWGALGGGDKEVTPKAATQSPVMVLDTPATINADSAHQQFKGLRKDIMFKPDQETHPVAFETTADVLLDGDKVGQALVKHGARQGYLKHDGNPGGIMTPTE